MVNSFHQKSLKDNLPLGHFQTLRYACDTEEEFDDKNADMMKCFTEREHYRNMVENSPQRAESLNIRQLRQINKNHNSL